MLTGRFGSTSGAPYVEARVSFPRLRLRGLVSFLVDTGADGTVLMPTDSKALGIDFRSLREPTTSEGIGGVAQGFNEMIVLSFSDRRYVYSYLLQIEISAPTTHNYRFPSLLGRDILEQWRMVMDTSKKHISFTPRSWDLRQKI
jgi:hypothetical protein